MWNNITIYFCIPVLYLYTAKSFWMEILLNDRFFSQTARESENNIAKQASIWWNFRSDDVSEKLHLFYLDFGVYLFISLVLLLVVYGHYFAKIIWIWHLNIISILGLGVCIPCPWQSRNLHEMLWRTEHCVHISYV